VHVHALTGSEVRSILGAMDADERLRLDYDQTSELIRALMDVRFKLLAVVPTVAVAAVGLLGSARSAAELLAVGVLGLLATVGLLLYDLRNTEILDAMLRHEQALERKLGLDVALEKNGLDGALSQFAPGRGRLFGLVTVGQERALGLVYGAALGGWSYLVAWGALRALDFSGAREVGGVIGALTAVAITGEVERIGREAKKAGERVAVDSS
jgi:hypothetical protein